jgi:hypothetical protein
MKSFKIFIEEKRFTTKYIAVQYDEATQKKLREWAIKNGFDLTQDYDGNNQDAKDFDFHTTIFYSTSEHDIKNEILQINRSRTAKVVDIEMLGVNNNIPVLKIESNDILKIRRYYEAEYDMKDAWPEYKPHISLSYSKNIIDTSKMKLPTFLLTFDTIKIADGKPKDSE